MAENEHNRIEEIKRRLYDPKDTTADHRSTGVLHPQNFKVEKEWKSESKPDVTSSMTTVKKPRTSLLKKFFIGAVVFFVCAVGFAVYMYSTGGVSVSNDNIDITVLGNAFAKGGEELPLQIEITNRNNASLELADLLIEYPRGANDNPNEVIRLPREAIGTIQKGQSITRNVKVTLFGDEKLVRNVKISLEYHPEGSNAIFTKSKEYPVTISSAPLSLRIDAPTEATANQLVSFTVTASLNTTLPTQDKTMLQIVYPTNFVFDTATPAPSVGQSVWSLEGLTQTTPVTIKVEGRLIGQDGDEQVFHVYAGTTNPTDASTVKVVYTSLLQTMTITKPFLEAKVLVNGQDLSTYTASGGETVNAQITWVNNLSTRIADVQIIANLSGNAFNRSEVNPLEGFYDSTNSRIVWDKNTVSDFASVEPGQSGTVSFSFKPVSLVGSIYTLKDPEVVLDVSIKGSQPSIGSTFSDVNNFAKKVVKIVSDLQIASSASYSSGALPPKAETETRYKVTWTLANSANTVNKAEARSALPIYVSWVGTQLESGSIEKVSYNATTREVIWNIGTVMPNTGVNTNREVSFIIALKPSLSQIGSVPQLMKNVYLTGTDSFTGTVIKNSRGPITTQLISDASFEPGNERVVE